MGIGDWGLGNQGWEFFPVSTSQDPIPIPLVPIPTIIKIYIKNEMGIGDWGLGIGDWGWGIWTNHQFLIPNFKSPTKEIYSSISFKNLYYFSF